jgi:hypothetical protein
VAEPPPWPKGVAQPPPHTAGLGVAEPPPWPKGVAGPPPKAQIPPPPPFFWPFCSFFIIFKTKFKKIKHFNGSKQCVLTRAGNLTRDTRTRHEHDTRKPG